MLAILASLVACSCSVLGAQQDLDQSEAAYERCEALSSGGSGDCESLEKNVESSQQNYDKTSSQVDVGPRRFQPRMNSNPTPTVDSTPDD